MSQVDEIMAENMRRSSLTVEERREEDLKELAEMIPKLEAMMPEFVRAYLQSIGVASHEADSDWSMVPEAIKRLIPQESDSFGLSGGFGAGKTFALVAILGNDARAIIKGHINTAIEKVNVRGLRTVMSNRGFNLPLGQMWVNWPNESAAKRAWLFKNFQSDVEDWIQSLMDPRRLLVLDDIGADRATAQDWTGEVLARVIDERLRAKGELIWTSNLDAKGLVERYGPRTFSRLQALAPVITLPKLPDLRLKGIA